MPSNTCASCSAELHPVRLLPPLRVHRAFAGRLESRGIRRQAQAPAAGQVRQERRRLHRPHRRRPRRAWAWRSNKALYNYMHGICLDQDVRSWFDRPRAQAARRPQRHRQGARRPLRLTMRVRDDTPPTAHGLRVALLFALAAQRLSDYYEHGQWLSEAQGATLAADWLARSNQPAAGRAPTNLRSQRPIRPPDSRPALPRGRSIHRARNDGSPRSELPLGTGADTAGRVRTATLGDGGRLIGRLKPVRACLGSGAWPAHFRVTATIGYISSFPGVEHAKRDEAHWQAVVGKLCRHAAKHILKGATFAELRARLTPLIDGILDCIGIPAEARTPGLREAMATMLGMDVWNVTPIPETAFVRAN